MPLSVGRYRTLSEHGAGALMRIDDSNWLKMGKLVALRRDPGDNFRLEWYGALPASTRNGARSGSSSSAIGPSGRALHPELQRGRRWPAGTDGWL